MKILNWMHRKFRQNVDYGLVTQKKGVLGDESKKVEHVGSTCEKETNALLLEQESLVDVFNGWHNGILTIGTFGIDQFKCLEEEEEEEQEEDNEEEEQDETDVAEEEEELNTSAIKALKEELEMVFGSNHTNNMEMSQQELPAAADNPLRRFLELPDFHTPEDHDAKKKGGRTTLADLFSADVAGKGDSVSLPPEKTKKPACRTKHGLSFAKKLMPRRKGEESGPSTKLHRMVTRMLKKKIHPEVELEIQVGVNGTQNKTNIRDCGSLPGVGRHVYDSNGNGIESISLLRDVVIEPQNVL